MEKLKLNSVGFSLIESNHVSTSTLVQKLPSNYPANNTP